VYGKDDTRFIGTIPLVLILLFVSNLETDKVLADYGLNNVAFMVDRMDAPWWMPYEGQPKPEKPSEPYPKDYPQ